MSSTNNKPATRDLPDDLLTARQIAAEFRVGDRVRCINPRYSCFEREGTVDAVRDDRPDSGEIIVTISLDVIPGLDNGLVDLYQDDVVPLLGATRTKDTT